MAFSLSSSSARAMADEQISIALRRGSCPDNADVYFVPASAAKPSVSKFQVGDPAHRLDFLVAGQFVRRYGGELPLRVDSTR